MSFQAGKYIIKSKSTVAGLFIGRCVSEDDSLLPKKILLLPLDDPAPEVFQHHVEHAASSLLKSFFFQWEIILVDHGSYVLKTGGNHVANYDEHVYAILSPGTPATKWKIEAQPQHGDDIFTYVESLPDNDRRPELLHSISEASGSGWVCPEEILEQVELDN